MTGELKNTDRKPLLLFLFGWAVLNLCQAYFTELAHDEAYYWAWSRYLDWGYIEHPPMVALFIKIGYALIPNEVGVRLLAIVFSTLVLYLVYTRLVKKDVMLYIALVSSILLFHVGGFLTAPDTPLFLFVALYYLLLKHYLESDDWKTTLLMILVITAMMYSKYHGVMVLFFTIVFNLKLLTRKSFWVIAVTSALLYLPHVYWLFTDGTPGLEYALSGRFSDPFSFYQVVGNFLLGQIAITGPLIGIIVLYAAFATKPKDSYQRALKYVMIGIIGYFFIWSFKGRTEANWTASAFIPMLVLAHQYITERVKLRKVVLWLAVPSFLIILAIRLQLMFFFIDLPHVIDRNQEFSGWKEFAERVNDIAQDYPVFTDGYKTSSKLWFYRGTPTYAFGNNDRPSQYDLWSFENNCVDQKVLALSGFLLHADTEIESPMGSMNYKWYNDFRSYRTVQLNPIEKTGTYQPNELLKLDVEVVPPTDWGILPAKGTPNEAHFSYDILTEDGKKFIFWNDGKYWFDEEITTTQVIPIEVRVPNQAGKYILRYTLVMDSMITWKVSEHVPIEVVGTNTP